LEQRLIPEPKGNQVLLKMEVVGICGSDVHYFVNGRNGPFILEKPMIIGHEGSGTVIQVGKSVKDLKPGDRVAIELFVGCRTCIFCKEGNYHLCADMVFSRNLSRYFVHDADFCYKLPDNITLEEGALMEPLSVGVHACKRADVRFGAVVLILGAGPIGLVSLLSAKAMGATKVIITDIVDCRLKIAKKLGANYTLKIEKNMTEEDIISTIRELLGEDPNITLDCTGVEQCVRVAVQVTRTRGVVTLVGMGKLEMNLPLTSALIREVDIRGVFRYNNDYPTAIEMVRSGAINVKPLITHHYRMEDTLKAFHTAKTGEGNAIKVLIHTNPDWIQS